MNDKENRKGFLVVLGAGESGIGAALLASQQGYDVLVSDSFSITPSRKKDLKEAGIEMEENGHSMDRILKADLVVKSPGIRETEPSVIAIRKAAIPLISELEFAFRFKGDSKIIGITGSNGKSTVTSLTYQILKRGGLDVSMVGNIGFSIARQMALRPTQWYVVEISSFMLDDIQSFRPDIAILLNITEDHLDRYDHKFENYINSKFRIIENQTAQDFFIYFGDDPVIADKLTSLVLKSQIIPFSLKREIKNGSYMNETKITVDNQANPFEMSTSEFPIKGMHNVANILAASSAASLVGIRKQNIREAIIDYHALEHRMEYVSTVRGVEFINDSKATNINSTWYALESVNSSVVLILGGTDKGNDYSILDDLVKQKVKAIVCLGVDNKKIKEHFSALVNDIIETQSATDCVHECYRLAEKGDTVLLSPACASFDLFKNFEDRGTQFKKAVMSL